MMHKLIALSLPNAGDLTGLCFVYSENGGIDITDSLISLKLQVDITGRCIA